MSAKGIGRAVRAFSSATLLSRILGFLRDMVIANFLGATGFSDAFFVAFRIPNLLRELFAEGSISSAFVPVLSEVRVLHGDEGSRRIASRIFTFLLLSVTGVVLLGEIFTPLIVKTIAPGFEEERFSITVNLARVMLPFLLFVSLAAFVMGALNVRRVFFVPALSSAWFNVTVISTLIILFYFGISPLIAAAVGVTLGGLMQFLTQVPSYLREGYSFRLELNLRDPWLRKMLKLLGPVVLGLAVSQLNIFIGTIVASFLPHGSVTYLYYAMRLIQLPVGVFGVAMAMAVLPGLSEQASRGDRQSLIEDFSYALRVLFTITVPASVGLLVLRVPIIGVLFQRGEFDRAATEGTAFALLFYSLGICAIVGVRLTASVFYAMQDTKTPVKTASLSLILNLLLSVLLMRYLGHGGIALAMAVSSWINFSMLILLLRRRLERIDGRRIVMTVMKVLVASSLMSIFCFAGAGIEAFNTGRFLLRAILLIGLIGGAVIVYLSTALVLRVQEAKEILNWFRR